MYQSQGIQIANATSSIAQLRMRHITRRVQQQRQLQPHTTQCQPILSQRNVLHTGKHDTLSLLTVLHFSMHGHKAAPELLHGAKQHLGSAGAPVRKYVVRTYSCTLLLHEQPVTRTI